MAGTSVDVLSTGDEVDPNHFRWLVAGVPGDASDDYNGFVRAQYAHVGSGLADLLWTENEDLKPPSSELPYYQLGWDVLAVDIRECHHNGVDHYDACGQELLASAPNTINTGPGEVYWWMADGQDNSSFEYVARIAAPAGSSTAAEFGYALAAARTPADPMQPWKIAGSYPGWVAISAPGDDAVYIYTVDPTSNTPLGSGPVDTLNAPIPGRGFGHDLVVGDFDADGLPDLAVSGPYDNGADLDGYVWVYRGTTLPTKPLHKASALPLKGAQLGPARGLTYHGWSLAAGAIAATHPGDILVAGAPLAGGFANGGFCQYSLSVSGPGFVIGNPMDDVLCHENQFASVTSATSPATGEHMGWSVAIGNYHAADGHGVEGTPEALLPELAVSRPGYDGDRGAVEVFSTDEDGVNTGSFWNKIQEYNGPLAGARFGESMAGGYVQETHWEDLVIGAPYADHVGAGFDGTASLTKAVETSSCQDVNGYWTLTDVDGGDPVSIKTWREETPTAETHLVFLTEFTFALHSGDPPDDDNLCYEDASDDPEEAIYILPPGTELVFPAAWPCVSPITVGTPYSHTWTNADLTEMFQAINSAVTVATADVTATLTFAADGAGDPVPSTFEVDLDLDTLSVTGTEVIMGVEMTGTFDYPGLLSYLDVDDPDNCMPYDMPLSMQSTSVGVCE